jgi:nitric oxide dioxygenase
MTPRQIELVQSSFAKVVPVADHAAKLFYQRLFDLDPSLRALFKPDMTEQRRKLMDSLRLIVVNLGELDRILPGIRALGGRHGRYGVTNEHYGTVGTALIDTLAKALGREFSDDARAAWLEAYTLLATTMQSAADEEEAA